MPSVTVEEPQLIPRIPGFLKPRPRSAGASNRPMRSENISELVRFFQASEEVLGGATAKHDGAMDLIKAGQRRLRQLGYAKHEKRATDTTASAPSPEKLKATHRQLVALQREGLLPASASVDDILDLSRPSRTKRDVEAMGRPWLDDTMRSGTSGDSSTTDGRQQRRARCESLGLGDLAALVEFSVSFPEYEDEPGPPPYQPTQTPAGDGQGQNLNVNEDSQNPPTRAPGSTVVEESGYLPPGPSPTLERTARPQQSSSAHQQRQSSQTVGNNHNKLRDDNDDSGETANDSDDASSLEVLLRATEQLERQKSAARSVKPAPRTTDQDVRPHVLNQGVTDTPFRFQTPPRNRPDVSNDGIQEDPRSHSIGFRDTASSGPPKNLNGGPIPLKLVAECLPPRTSSRSIVPVVPKPASPQTTLDSVLLSTNDNDLATSSRHLGSVRTPTANNFPRPQTLLSPFPIQPRRARSVTPNGQPGLKKRRTKQKGSPLYTVSDIAPLPPPTKPLPSLPPAKNSEASNPAPTQLVCAGNSVQMPVSSTPAAIPVDPSNGQDDSPTLRAPVHKPKLRSPIRPRPSSRATALLSNDGADRGARSIEDHSLRSVSSADSGIDVLCRRRGREDKVRALRLRDLSDVSVKKDRNTMDRSASALEPSPASQIGNQVVHSHLLAHNLSRGKQHRVSAAPRIPLPNDPPVAAHSTPTRRGRAGSASSLPASSGLHDDGLSRTTSIRSTSGTSPSIRRGRDVHTIVGTSNRTGRRRSESPSLPSSDDEGHGIRVGSSRAHEHTAPDRRHHGQRDHSQQRQSHARDTGRSNSHSLTTVGAASQGQLSPRSLYSQRTSHSHDSQLSQSRSMRMLEARVAMLERQNKMLQAALLAALDIGVSHDVERNNTASPALDSVITMSQNHHESPGTTAALNGLGIDEPRYGRKTTDLHAARPDSWASGHDDTSRGSFETTVSRSDDSVRVLESMLNDFDVNVS